MPDYIAKTARRAAPRALLLFIAFVAASCTNIFLQPSQQDFHLSIPAEIASRQLFINSLDGTQLSCWLLSPAAPASSKGTVYFLHGNSENLTTHLTATFWLVREGYTVFGIDYRGYGKSSGVSVLGGVHNDAMAGLMAAAALEPDKPLILFGQSLGGSIALYTAAHYPDKGRIRALIADSPFAGYRRVVRQKLGSWALTWPLQWPLSLLLFSDRYSAEDSLEGLSGLGGPVILLHNEDDPVVPVQNSQHLYERLKELGINRVFFRGEAGGHIDMLKNPEVRKEVLDLLKD